MAAAVIGVACLLAAPVHDLLVDTIRNGSVEDARQACEFRPCPLSAVALSALNHLRNVPQADPTLLKDIVDRLDSSTQATLVLPLALLVMCASVLIPFFKIAGMLFLVLTIRMRGRRLERRANR